MFVSILGDVKSIENGNLNTESLRQFSSILSLKNGAPRARSPVFPELLWCAWHCQVG